MSIKTRTGFLLILILVVIWMTGCKQETERKESGPVLTEPVQTKLSSDPVGVPPTGPPVVSAGQDYNHEYPGSGVPVLMYHSIANLPGNNLGLSPEKFAQQMQYLHDAGFTSISLDTLYAVLQDKGKLPPKPVVITFDDGYPNSYSVAFPILKQHNLTATIFVVSAWVDHGMLTWTQLKEMQAYGISIQSHTVNHLDLRTLSPAQQKQELAASKAEIENRLQSKVNFFCYPSGKYNIATLSLLKDLGYEMAVTTAYGKVKLGDNFLELKRVRINGDDSLDVFKQKLK